MNINAVILNNITITGFPVNCAGIYTSNDNESGIKKPNIILEKFIFQTIDIITGTPMPNTRLTVGINRRNHNSLPKKKSKITNKPTLYVR
ncbi:hypothetical protein B5E53_13515 [Eubacterium sp. An11]|nr:hypothetical protein B5E53_13515 [Eubacterium sp. An11]